jgi:hypothetical protein
MFDILLILDSPYSALAVTPMNNRYGRIELLAATGNTATPSPGPNSFTSIMIGKMKDMIAKYGMVEIPNLHSLLSLHSSGLYATPVHIVLRPGTSSQAIVLENLRLFKRQKRVVVPEKTKAPGEQEQNEVELRASMISNPPDDNSFSHPISLLSMRDQMAQSSRDETINTLSDIDSQQPSLVFDIISQAQDTNTTTMDTSHVPSNLRIRALPNSGEEVRDEDMYSIASSSRSTLDTTYISHFVERLLDDSKTTAGLEHMREMPPSQIEPLLEGFAGRLHEESTTPFAWNVSARLHRGSRYVYSLYE